MSSIKKIKITKKIIGYKVNDSVNENSVEREVIHIQKPLLQRGEALEGSTYKIKNPNSEHAFYVTINDSIVDVKGEEKRVPFEIFINTKNMEHYMWIVALTRVISAIFRKGDDVNFLVEELKSVFDPRGGYFKRGGTYISSLVAEIGMVIEEHLKKNGLSEEKEASVVDFIEKKKEEFLSINKGKDPLSNAGICNKCSAKSVVLMDSCMTCLECGNSKCG